MHNTNEMTRIILLDGSPFLHEVLKKAIDKQEGLKIVADIDDIALYPKTAMEVEADWTYLLLSPGRKVPISVQDVIEANPEMGLLVMATDGSSVRVRWVEQHEEDLDVEELAEIFDFLRNKGIPIENNIQ